MASNGTRFNVGGVLLPRPFKIRRLGHFGFNAVHIDAGRDFYAALLGFKPSDTLDFGKMPWAPKGTDLGDTNGYFMRYGTDHHAFVLFNKRVLANVSRRRGQRPGPAPAPRFAAFASAHAPPGTRRRARRLTPSQTRTPRSTPAIAAYTY